MVNVLSIDDARAALRIPASDTTSNDDLTSTYIPAVDTIIESLSGPQIASTGRTLTVDGGHASILLPVGNATVTSLTESGTTLSLNSDYTVNSLAGIVSRGTVYQPYVFLPGYQNVVVTYSAGPSSPPANVKLAARIILASLFQPDLGAHPDFGNAADDDTVMTASGFAIPRRAVELLRPTPAMPGFA